MSDRLVNRVRRISDTSLPMLGVRTYAKIQGKMESLGWNALRYGWDWPTACALHPRLTNRHTVIRDEVVRRANVAGLTIVEWINSIHT